MRELPHALTKLFKISELAGESISHVLNSSIVVINELLEQGGIGAVPGIESPPRRVVEVIHEQRVDPGDEVTSSEEGPGLSQRFDTPSSSISREDATQTSLRQPVARPRSPSLIYHEVDEDLTPDAWLALLDNVIRIARRTTIPDRNTLVGPTNGQFHPDFDHDAAFGTRSQGQMNHDFKIGAAGELFVSRLNSKSCAKFLQCCITGI